MTKKTQSKSSDQTVKKADLLVTGDTSIDRFIYLEGFADVPPSLREAWINARKFWNVTLPGAAGSLAQYLMANGTTVADPCVHTDLPESIYLLTRKPKDDRSGWYVDKAIVAGERDFPSGDLKGCSPELFSQKTPCIVLDFNQGWIKRNIETLPEILRDRSFLIRSHDPCKEQFQELRKKKINTGIWFSPVQDMADGSLWFPGNWESLQLRVLNYLQDDATLWKNSKWQHYVIVQLSYDGALILGPGLPEQGELFIFAGDQPGSFAREGYGTVVAGGIVFVGALAEALLSKGSLTAAKIRSCVEEGLSHLRQLVINGYCGPDDSKENWDLPTTTNLPVDALKKLDRHNIILYTGPPKAEWQTACQIVCGSDNELSRNIVFRLGNLITSSPDYSQTLLRLTSRVQNHLNSDDKVLSFAIFGGPGSGKSFVAKQIAKSIDPEKKHFEYKTFNISQFTDPSRLTDAFKQIQSISLQGKVPFIMWDEFDTSLNGRKCGWLSSFLMPMQDAEFFDGFKNQALGKAVYVFIGGTFPNEDKFGEWAMDSEGKDLKGTDFHSRLDSSLTVPSVDYPETPKNILKLEDPSRLVRAVLIKNFLKDAKKVKCIAPDVLSFLFHVPLEHGVRSLQKIIGASELSRTVCFQSYHLPPLDVLRLHVDTTQLDAFGSLDDFINEQQRQFSGKDPLEISWRK